MEAWSGGDRVKPRSGVTPPRLRQHSGPSRLQPLQAGAQHLFKKADATQCIASGGDKTMLPPFSAPGSSRSKPKDSPRQSFVKTTTGPLPSNMLTPNSPTSSCGSSITTAVPEVDRPLSKAELDDQFGMIFEAISSLEGKTRFGMTTQKAPERRRRRSMSMYNPRETPQVLFADRIIAQEELAAKAQKEFAAEEQAATGRVVTKYMAQGSGVLRSIEDHEFDAYSPNTCASDALKVTKRAKAMSMLLTDNAVDRELLKLGGA